MSRQKKRLGGRYARTSLRSKQVSARQRKISKTRRFETLEVRQVLDGASVNTTDVTDDAALVLTDPLPAASPEGSYVEVQHFDELALEEGAVHATFSLQDVDQRQTLFSKDHRGFEEGGHLTAWVADGRVEARLQSEAKSYYLKSAENAILEGQQHDVIVSFGEHGFRLYVDGLIADAEVDIEQGIAENDNSLMIGASTVTRTGDKLNLKDLFEGSMSHFAVYTDEVGLEEAAILAGNEPVSLDEPTWVDGMLHGTDSVDVLWMSRYDSVTVDTGYGNDGILGTSGSDVLSGGHGQDVVFGAAGDDLLISRSDGREPMIAQDYSGEDPRDEVDPTTSTLYPYQPIASDDLLIGGSGADTFRFEILINAKERILFKHVNDDGTIDWKGVTGENNEVHDHWVERLGDEVIYDFNRAEGDTIQIAGHTVEVYKLTHHDTDDDGVLDASVLHLQSNQGNAGAHNKDQLGTITVYGDLVRQSDYTVHAHANLGIVDTIGELGEALAPRHSDPLVTDGQSRWLLPTVNEAPLPQNAIFATGQTLLFDAEEKEYVQVEHNETLALESGSIALSFTAEETQGRQTLFSKDHSGLQNGGHLTAWVKDGRIEVRLQSATKSVVLRSAEDSVVAGQEHHVAVTFGEDGFRLFVDGLIADAEVDFTQGIAANNNPLVLGANAWTRNADKANLSDFFAGSIDGFTVYDHQLELNAVAELAGLDLTPLAEPTVIEGLLVGTEDGEQLNGSLVDGSYGNDGIVGTSGSDVLSGGHGQDVVFGAAGDDLLISRSDGREPVIAQDYSGEDPRDEVDPTTSTLYPYQPIASDDLLIGGSGADTFRFEILINAKERILFKHVNDDGTIDWKGVTGENNEVHDHWVERLGDEVIYDFNRAEGDTIQIAGHTVEVYKLTHHDTDDDGVLDASVLHLQSNQGNAGAHNKDQLGTITVYGDLVRQSDYTVHAHANLGIVDTIGELGEALAPRHSDPLVTDGQSRWLLPTVNEAPLPQNAIFATGQTLLFDAEEKEYVQVEHNETLALESGSIALSFTAEETQGRQTLFSKDHSGLQNGGHLTAQLHNGKLEVRLQSDTRSVVLRSSLEAIEAGEEHRVLISFGSEGFRLYLDGLLIDAEEEFTQGIAENTNSLVLGASTKTRNGEKLNLRDYFSGEIHDFTVYDTQVSTEVLSSEADVSVIDDALAAL